MAPDDKYWILISNYLANELSDTETDELLSWVAEAPENGQLLREMQSAWEKSNEYQKTLKTDVDVDAAWKKVEARLFADSHPKTQFKPLWRWTSIAASLFLIISLAWLGVSYYQKHQTITFANNLETQQQLLLPDGSNIWLNKGAKVSYKKGLENLSQREVELSGEAFFEVQHNPQKPFIIHAGGTKTQVLGTSFNVDATTKKVSVAVISGKVSFAKENGKAQLFLLPGEKGTYTPNGSLAKSAFKNTNFLFWKNRQLNFENEPLKNVLAEIETIYRVRFVIKSSELQNLKLTTSFKSASIHQIIDVLEASLDVKIEKSDNAYIVVK